MSNIEKIRQEIDRRKKICEGIFERESDTYYQGKAVAYGEALAFIDSLPEEACKDSLHAHETCKENQDSFTSLEEAAEEYSQRVTDGHNYRDLTCGFIAGAKWMANQRPEREDRNDDNLPRYYGD